MSITKCIITVKIVSDIEVEFASVKKLLQCSKILAIWENGKLGMWILSFYFLREIIPGTHVKSGKLEFKVCKRL